MYYTYAYLDPRKEIDINKHEIFKFNFEPIYIGSGSGNRMSVHKYHAEKCIQYGNLTADGTRNPEFIKCIIDILNAGLDPIIIKISKYSTKQESDENEILLIKSIGRLNLNTGSLFNLTDVKRFEKTLKLPHHIKVKRMNACNKSRMIKVFTKLIELDLNINENNYKEVKKKFFNRTYPKLSNRYNYFSKFEYTTLISRLQDSRSCSENN